MRFGRILFLLLITVAVAGIVSLGVFNRYLIKLTTSKTILSPIGNSFSIFSLLKEKQKPKKIIYGYLPYWSSEQSKFLQLDKLTDIAYFGIYINADGSLMELLEDGTAEPGLRTWREDEALDKFIVKAKNNGVRVSLTIISHVDEISDKFLDCRECWPTLLKNIEKELDSKKIKDINFNFEYVEFTEPDKAKKYTELVEYYNNELDKKYKGSFVTVATFADSLTKPRVTDIEQLGKVADALFIMSYDFHRPDSDIAGPVAPIDGKGVYSEYDVRTMLTDYLAKVPSHKIILGVPYYGYNWVVKAAVPYSERIPGADAIGYSKSQAYWQIMDTILELKPEVKWDDLGKVPYFTYISPETGSTREVYFENDKSLAEKYKLIIDNNLAGVGIWALGYDGGYQELWDLLQKSFIGK